MAASNLTYQYVFFNKMFKSVDLIKKKIVVLVHALYPTRKCVIEYTNVEEISTKY